MRTCPHCQNKSDQAHIYSVLNDMYRGENDHYIIDGRCQCTACNGIWDEEYNETTHETKIFVIKRPESNDD